MNKPNRMLLAVIASAALASGAQAQLADGVPSDAGLFDAVINFPSDTDPGGNFGDNTGATLTQINFNAGSAIAGSDRDYYYVEANFYDGGLTGYRPEFYNSEINVFGGNIGGQTDIEAGSTLNMSGGTTLNTLDIFGTANISGGSIGDYFDAETGSVVNISGGDFGDNFDAKNGSLVNISAGSIGNSFDAESGSVVHISGGSFGTAFNPNVGSEVNITGGDFDRFFLNEGSNTNISGGTYGVTFRNFSGATVNFFGTEFSIDGEIIPGLSLGDQFTITDRDVTLTGLLADGSAIDFDLTAIDDGVNHWFASDSTVTVTLVPEPSSLAMLGLGGLALVRRRRR